ncbi:MAG: cyanophycin synthetase [Dethiobacter sp.]|jgi:cyanophycin synthetase|nr:cyanophycin synthetase [Dethiobacter sp.]
MKIIEARAIEGASIYSYRPTIKLIVDLKEAAEKNSKELKGFNHNLLKALPSLRSHYCSRGYSGGFLERLEEGTYLGHVLEHIILELMHRCGIATGYGKTFSGPQPGQAEIIFEYTEYRPALYLSQIAVNLVNALLNGKSYSLHKMRDNVDQIRQRFEPGPSTAAIVKEAKRRKIPVTFLEEGKSLLVLGYGSAQRKMQATLTSGTSCLAADLAGDKCRTKECLKRAGIPTPRGEVVMSESQAVAAASRIKGPVVVKPCDGNQGKGVSLNLADPEAVSKAYHLARRYSPRIMVEEYINGRHYRLLVVGGRMVAAARLFPAQVLGDGSSTVAELIKRVNADPSRGIGHARPLTRIELNQETRAVLERQGINEYYCPDRGEVVLLRENANLSTGGIAWDVTFKVNPANTLLAERAATAIGLDIAGIDLVTPDIGAPITLAAGAVIEVNAAPGIRMHLYPARGKGQNVAGPILDMLFTDDSCGRIPIAAISGTNGKTTTARILAHILKLTGKTVGLTTTEGVYIGDHCICKGDTTGPFSARMVLLDAHVDAAVLETARGGIIRGGLGFEYSDVAVITNISEDHLGQDGLETANDLVFVKSLLVETVHSKGAVILNADDPNVLKMLPRANAAVILFALREDNPALLRHLNKGGRGLTVREGFLSWFCGSRWQKLVRVKNIPLTDHGRAPHQLQNIMAASAAALALKTPRSAIVKGIATFTSSAEQNPGRMNLYTLQKGRLLLDYGHNPAAMEVTLQYARRLGCRRLLGVIGVPGDRNNDLIKRCGQVCAHCLDLVIIKEDHDLRGRRPGETARLLWEGCRENSPASKEIRVILNESDAVSHGLELLHEDDLLVVFYEKREPIEARLQSILAGSAAHDCPELSAVHGVNQCTGEPRANTITVD